MFDIEGFPPVRPIAWRSLRPGMIVAGGVSINGHIPPELRDFPVLDQAILEDLWARYQFMRERRVLVLDPSAGGMVAARQASRRLLEMQARMERLNQARKVFREMRRAFLRDEEIFFESRLVEAQSLLLDRWNSFQYQARPDGRIPSFFSNLSAEYNLAEVLAANLTAKLELPKDLAVDLHLVIDYSRSMQLSGRDSIARLCAELLCRQLSGVLSRLRVHLYAFSERCLPIAFPPRGTELARGETNFLSFVKTVLRHRVTAGRNHLILLSDGEARDAERSLPAMEDLARAGVDFTQLVFCLPPYQKEYYLSQGPGGIDGYLDPGKAAELGLQALTRTEEDYARELDQAREGYAAFSNRAGGNLIILTEAEAAGVATAECFDRYIGQLSQSRAGIGP